MAALFGEKVLARYNVWSRGVARWCRCGLSVADTFVVGASLAPPCFRFHTPLIEPDVRSCRIRLSEKGSRGRPRETARPRNQTDEA